ncbi:uncharacterized protein LAESUDRAFT_760074 [Laetiporus sulphureus 93-53]|uniref:Uncharacterized protein n=1 Tax=Laetiporus sulphureus 93-53 TaxID=1314785 RepID=A0A165DS46_9APHY|nr:uncharacterized protein LAESUDRAFT_760074 [Laetiporus sulphureus 93-53]KZT05517.1 hypothetical protein LAESUDRAFT_760074 [Laetiporus sulphureus 93-53]
MLRPTASEFTLQLSTALVVKSRAANYATILRLSVVFVSPHARHASLVQPTPPVFTWSSGFHYAVFNFCHIDTTVQQAILVLGIASFQYS